MASSGVQRAREEFQQQRSYLDSEEARLQGEIRLVQEKRAQLQDKCPHYGMKEVREGGVFGKMCSDCGFQDLIAL